MLCSNQLGASKTNSYAILDHLYDIEHSLAFHKPKHARISPAIDETDNESVNCVCHNESYRASLPTE